MNLSTLENLCLLNVSKYMTFYCDEYSGKYGVISMYSLEFLRAHYSYQLLNLLLNKGTLKNEHIPFLINEYTKKIDLYRFPEFIDKEILRARLVEIGNTLIEFSVPGEETFLAFNSVLRNFTFLRVLVLKYTNCSDDTLSAISASCPFLESLDVYACSDVSDIGMVYIGILPLRILDISWTSVTEDGIIYVLETIPTIHHIMHVDTTKAICKLAKEHTQDGVLNYNKVFSLAKILSNEPEVELEIISMLCPRVKDLSVCNIQKQKTLNYCLVFTHLEHLEISCCINSSEIHADFLLKECGSSLRYLSLHTLHISANVILTCCSKLTSLSLSLMTFLPLNSKEACNHLLPNLTELCIAGLDVSNPNDIGSFAMFLSSAVNLKCLKIKFLQFPKVLEDLILKSSTSVVEINSRDTPVALESMKNIIVHYSSLQRWRTEDHVLTHQEYHDLMEFVALLNRDIEIVW